MFSNFKKKISNFFFISNNDGEEESKNYIFKNYLGRSVIEPSYINENEHIYDAPSLYYFNMIIQLFL